MVAHSGGGTVVASILEHGAAKKVIIFVLYSHVKERGIYMYIHVQCTWLIALFCIPGFD